jgi:ABC-2 type transport system ATP-binding protein
MQHVRFHYEKKPLFTHLDLEIPSGTIYGLLGVNGAGKTTLLKLISGQLFPQDGTISVLGCTPKERDPKMLQDLFHLPEEFYLPNITAQQYLKTYAPFYPKFDESAFLEYCREFEVSLTQSLHTLSFGQKKKFLLSFGLASNTALLILDEPTNGLDIPSKSQFRRTVASAMTDERTFIISTHQVRDMGTLIDPVIIIDAGEVVCNSTLDAVAQQFTMVLERTVPSSEDVVYSEQVPGGYMAMYRRKETDEETSIDLEVLFNAIIAQPGLLKNRSESITGGLA